MANWHALAGTGDGNSYSIVYHLAVPNSANPVGINYRTALVNSGLGGKTILPDGDGTGGTISAAEKASIQSGALYEYAESFATNPGQSLAALQAAIDARWAVLNNAAGPVITDLSGRLKYFGATH